jgi:UDP-N-acetyl-D-glucosamine dehydrogenase
MPFWPGPGLGGHCIPIDPHYLSWKLKTLNYNARFIEMAGEINSHMPDYVVDLVGEALNEAGKAVKGSKILVLGVAYKKNVDDCRESPAIDVIELLRKRGASVSYADPHVPELRHDPVSMDAVPYDAATISAADCVVVVTDHAAFDPDLLARHAKVVVDTRNMLKGRAASGTVVKL